MKRKLFLGTSLAILTTLTSCGGSTFNGNFYLGDAFTNLNAIVVEYNINDSLESGSKISGKIKAQKNTVLKDSYILAYSSTMPSSNYAEQALIQVSKSQIEATKEGDEYAGVKYDLTLDLEKVFPKDIENKNAYFVVHAFDWEPTNIATYGYTKFSYTWEGSKVKLGI